MFIKIPVDIMHDNVELSEKWCILHTYRGSVAHGLYIPSDDPMSVDDIDTMAICVPPKEYYLGLKTYGSRGTREIKQGEWDIVIYEAKKAISMLAKGNPNVLSLLWMTKEQRIWINKAGWLLVNNRDAFVGKHVYKSFTGYANTQLKRMTRFNFEGYMGSKRKAIVEKYGYDTKNASHLIRLLRMGVEFLESGQLQVWRVSDHEQLLSIKRGEWSLYEVKKLADLLFEEGKEAYEKSNLPDGPDIDRIGELTVRIVETAWEYKL